MMTNKEQVARAIRSNYRKDELVDLILDYVRDVSWNKDECVDIMSGIFGEETFDYDSFADKLMSNTTSKVELFSAE